MTARGYECVALLVLLLVSGCGGPTPPTTLESASTTTTPPRFGAPVVSNPVDASGLLASPCTSTLSALELRTMAISTSGRPRSYLGAVGCSWTSDADDRLSVAVDAQRDLLVDSYRSRLTPIFEPVTIEGFPAVRQRTSTEFNTCTVTVGLGPQQSLEVDWTGSTPPSPTEDPCANAEEAIALVVRKLPPQR